MNFNRALRIVTRKIDQFKNHPVFGLFNASKKRYLGIIINSTVIYVFVSLLVLLIYQTATVIAASSFGIHLIYFYNRIYFLTSGKSTVWCRDSILTVFSGAPAVTIYIAAICVVVFLTRYKKESRYKLLFVWGYTLILNRIISIFAIGLVFTLWGSNLIIDWMYFDRSSKIVFCAFSIIILLFIGKVSARAFLYTSDSPLLVKTDDKKLIFLFTQAMIPALLGNIILFILLLPHISFIEVAVALSSLIMLIPIFFNYKSFEVIEAISMLGCDIRDEQYNIDKLNILILLVFYILYRLVFIKGIFV